MALITCPECGKEVSDQAEACPNCGYPIAKKYEKKDTDDTVKIKMCILNTEHLNARQKATVSLINGSKKELLWEGQVGEIAEIKIEGKAEVAIDYQMNALRYGGHCTGIIDTSLGNKYQVVARRGVMNTILTLQRVDMLTSD